MLIIKTNVYFTCCHFGCVHFLFVLFLICLATATKVLWCYVKLWLLWCRTHHSNHSFTTITTVVCCAAGLIWLMAIFSLVWNKVMASMLWWPRPCLGSIRGSGQAAVLIQTVPHWSVLVASKPNVVRGWMSSQDDSAEVFSLWWSSWDGDFRELSLKHS